MPATRWDSSRARSGLQSFSPIPESNVGIHDAVQREFLVDGRVIPRVAVFIRPSNVPHADGLLAGLGCDVDQAGFPIVDAFGQTSTVGVWAAGNVVDPRFQVITSAGAGSAAAIAINANLVQDDAEQAIAGRFEK